MSSDFRHRQSIRLKGYDYSQAGAYFVTICAHNRECFFGEIVNGEMVVNELGEIAGQCWQEIPEHFPHVELGEWIMMPNHVHGIICIVNDMTNAVGAKNFSPFIGANDYLRANDYLPLQHGTSKTIGSIVRGFKIGVTKWARQNTNIHQIWQRNYYEHIIRNEQSLEKIQEHIVNNPVNWQQDEMYQSAMEETT